MVERRTGTALWAGGTALAWAGATLLVSRTSHLEVLYSPLVVFAALFVSPWYGAGLCLVSLTAMAALIPDGDAWSIAPAALATVAVSGAAIHAAQQRRGEREDFGRILSLIGQVSSRLDATEVPAAIVRTAREATDTKASSLRLLAPDGRTLEVRAAHGLSRAYMEKGPVDVRRSPIDRKVLEGEIVQIRDAANDPRFQYPEDAQQEGITSVLCVPLRRRDAVIGVLRVYSAHPRHFSPRDTRMLVALADEAVIALRHAELHRATLAFMRKVTHELRAPLAAIGSYLKVLLEGITGALTEQQREMLQRADRRTTLLLEAVKDLLSLSRARLEKPTEAKTELQLAGIVDSVVSLMGPHAERARVDLNVEIDSTIPLIAGSPEELEELVSNLVSNAIKYTPEGGRVSTSVSANGHAAVLRIADTGIGIPSADLPRLFDEFHRCKNARDSGIEGTGLGMAIVKTIADRHRAKVRVKSDEGEGTTVEVRFPLNGE